MAARRLPPADRRAQLVDAALRVFATHPEEDVRLEDISAAAGVTRNLLYRYFSSRADLQLAALEEAIARLAGRMDLDAARPLADRSPRNIAMWLDLVEAGDPPMHCLMRAARSTDADVAAAAAGAREALARQIAANHLGGGVVPAGVLAALDAYLVLGDRLIEHWLAGTLQRAHVERVLADVLPPLVAAVRG